MPFLLLYLGEGRKFDEKMLMNAIQSLPELSQPSEHCLANYHFEVDNDFTIIRIKKDKEAIVIDGSGDASLSAALHIQSHYTDDVHMADEGYSFDLVLNTFASLNELRDRINNSGK